MSLRNWDVEEFKECNNGLILDLNFLFEQNHYDLVDIVDRLVDHRLLEVLEWLKWC